MSNYLARLHGAILRGFGRQPRERQNPSPGAESASRLVARGGAVYQESLPSFSSDQYSAPSRPGALFGAPQGRAVRPGGGMVAAGDSGMVTDLRTADHRKAGMSGRIRGWARTIGKGLGFTDRGQTSEMGAASTASPSTYAYTTWQLRYDRRTVIQDCRLMVLDDSRARRSTLKFAREAARKGVSITFTDKTLKDAGKANAKIALECASLVERIINPKATGWAWMLHVEGDLFIQPVIADGELKGAKRMPAISMERCTDDADEFLDPENRAFVQVDVTTDDEVAQFPEALIHHERWNHVDGEKYGTSEIIGGRRLRRLLELIEAAQSVRRMARAPRRTLWAIGTPEKQGNWAEVNEFKAQNGFVDGQREVFDPMNVAGDYFGNGMVTATPLDGDSGVSDIGDIEYLQGLYVNTALPTPAAIYNLGGTTLGQDAMAQLRDEWLREANVLSDALVNVARYLLDVALLLRGVLPETVPASVTIPESNTETATDLIERVLRLRGVTIGVGQTAEPDPMLSKKSAMRMVAPLVDNVDVEEEMAAIEKEMEERRKKSIANAKEQQDALGQAAPGGPQAGQQGPPAPGQGMGRPPAAVGGVPRQNQNVLGSQAMRRPTNNAPTPKSATDGYRDYSLQDLAALHEVFGEVAEERDIVGGGSRNGRG